MSDKSKLVGINHVALEVGDLEAALAFYGRIFEFELRGRVPGQVFIDLGDQFIALAEASGDRPVTIPQRHFGLVVDDGSTVMAAAAAAGARLLPDQPNNFVDPWGNRVEIVAYADVQFTKSDAVLAVQGIDPDKTEKAQSQLRRKGVRLDE